MKENVPRKELFPGLVDGAQYGGVHAEEAESKCQDAGQRTANMKGLTEDAQFGV